MKIFITGSFNPAHKGHEWLIGQALSMCDNVNILICQNHNNPESNFNVKFLSDKFPECNVQILPPNTTLTEYVQSQNGTHILRGLRDIKDFEKTLVNINEKLSCIKTIFVVPPPELRVISSSLIRELKVYGGPSATSLIKKLSLD